MIFGITLSTKGQSHEENYLKAKDYFKRGEYTFAIEYFRNLAKEDSDNKFKAYASFYYGLASYKDGQLNAAKSMWLQMTEKNKKWKSIRDVYYWLSVVYFDESSWSNAILYAKKSKLPEAETLIENRLNQLPDVSQLEKLHYQFPDDKNVAVVLANNLLLVPISTRNITLLGNLIDKFDLDSNRYLNNNIGESQKKDKYKVAVLLPFMFEGLNKPNRTVRNKFVMDLYHGIEEAVSELNIEKTVIELYAYDTRMDSLQTTNLLLKQELKSMDLIIGPLFPIPNSLVSDFSFKNKINVINPLSTSSETVGNNPYSFLFKSSVETNALVAAQLAIDSIENKNAMVFYENNAKDSVNAYTYAQRIQEEGFEVLLLQGLADSTVNTTFKLLTEKYEIQYKPEEAEAIRSAAPDRIIKERKSIHEKDVIEYYEEFFKIAPDSIGHIYVSSSKVLFASNYISAIEIRADSTQIIGNGAWKNSETLTFEEMERLGIYFVDPGLINYHNNAYEKFQNMYLKKYKKSPSVNSSVGYELMSYVGFMLNKYGHYFQTGHIKEGYRKGEFFQGLEYGQYNSNQYVPITKLVDSKLIIVNSK